MGQIEIVKFAPTDDEIEYRKALVHVVLPEMVRKMEVDVDLSLVKGTARFAAECTLAFVDAMIETLED